MHNLDTLYISDLDGTLLTPECKVSDETASALNTMIAQRPFFYGCHGPKRFQRRSAFGEAESSPAGDPNEWSSHLRYGKTGACFRMPD